MNARRSRPMDVPRRREPSTPLEQSALALRESSSSSSDTKLSPTVLLQADRRTTAVVQQHLEQSPAEITFAYNGSFKTDEPQLPTAIGWRCSAGSAVGGGASAGESTRESDDGGDAGEQGSMSEARAGGGRHVCTICGTSFTMLGNLNRHKKSHMNVRPYNCNFCTRGFLRRTSFVEHVRLHTGEKPYACTACGQSFVRKKCFQTHAKCCPGGADSGGGSSGSLGPQLPGEGTPAVTGDSGGGDYATTASQILALAEGRCNIGTAAGGTGSVDVPLLSAAVGIASLPSVVHRQQHVVPATTAVPHSISSLALHGSRFFGAKSLARHQPGIGRTSFSIMKKARSTQLSRWKKQHLGGHHARPPVVSAGTSLGGSSTAAAAAVAAGSTLAGCSAGGSLLSRRAVIEGHRRTALRMQPDDVLDGGGGKASEQQRLALPSAEAIARSASGGISAPGLSPSRISGGQSLCCPIAAAASSAVAAAASAAAVAAAAAAEQLPCGGSGASVPDRRSVSPASAFAMGSAAALQGNLSSPLAATAASAAQRSPSTGAAVVATPPQLAAMTAALPLLQSGGSAGPLPVGHGQASSPVAGRSPVGVGSTDPATPFASLPRDAKLFHCRHCDIYFANLVTFLLHRGLHGEGDPLKCSICGKVCRDANEFLIHH